GGSWTTDGRAKLGLQQTVKPARQENVPVPVHLLLPIRRIGSTRQPPTLRRRLARLEGPPPSYPHNKSDPVRIGSRVPEPSYVPCCLHRRRCSRPDRSSLPSAPQLQPRIVPHLWQGKVFVQMPLPAVRAV